MDMRDIVPRTRALDRYVILEEALWPPEDSRLFPFISLFLATARAECQFFGSIPRFYEAGHDSVSESAVVGFTIPLAGVHRQFIIGLDGG